MDNIVVTGVSTGIGEYVARRFLRAGHRVFGSIRKLEDAEVLQKAFPETFVPLVFDVTDHESVHKAALKVQESVGQQGIQLLVNNAGVAVYGATTTLDLEDFQYQFDVNFFGVVAVTKMFLPLLGAAENVQHLPGKIFNISSVAAGISTPFLGPYCASKSALDGFSHALRRELLLYGIDVVIISPGAIKTPIWNKVEELNERERNSDYGKILEGFRKMVMQESEKAMPVEDLAERIFQIYLKPKPKARYVIMDKKFTKWTIPKYLLGHRQLDGYFKKIIRK